VPGRSAEAFKFTSALPVQVLKGMAPILMPYLQPGNPNECKPPQAAVHTPPPAGNVSND